MLFRSASRHFTIQTDHDSLKNLANQPSVNRRIWKWVQVLQGYDCDLVHIPGKKNPADFLSRRSLKDVKEMVHVREEEESLVKRLLLGEDKSDDGIQKKLDQVFAKSRPEVTQAAGQEDEMGPSLFVARSRISLAKDLREGIKKGLRADSRWADIISQLESAQDNVIIIGDRSFRQSGGLLEMRDSDKNRKTQWRLVVPDVPDIKRQIMRELHEVPYAGHLGYHKTMKNIQKTFYWPEHTLDIRDFVMGCPVCQQEKAVHRVPAGLLQPLKLPEQKWADVSMDYIMGLPKSEAGNDGILTVVDRATKMVHLAPVM